MLKYFLFFSILFFSCNKISEQPLETFENSNALSENREFEELVQEIKESSQFEEFSLLLLEENFVSKTILDGRVSIDKWSQIEKDLKEQPLEKPISQDQIKNILQDNSNGFNNYIAGFKNSFISLHDEFLIDLTDDQKYQVFEALFEAPENSVVTTRTSCCAGCQAKYNLCTKHANETAAVQAGGIILTGLGASIASGNPYILLGSIVVGAVVGGVSSAVGGTHCYEKLELCLAQCAEDCN